MKKRVVVVGELGNGSARDDATLSVLARGLNEAYPDLDLELTVLTRGSEADAEAIAGAISVKDLDHEGAGAAAGRWFHGLNPGDDTTDLCAVAAAIASADLVVALAGNPFDDRRIDVLAGPLPRLAIHAFLADVHATPLFLYGIASAPLRTSYGTDLAGWILRTSACVTCRDESSRRVLGELASEVHVDVLPDPLLGLAPASDDEIAALFAEEEIDAANERPRLAVALDGRANAQITAALSQLGRDYELLFVPCRTTPGDDDREHARVLARELRGVRCHLIEQRHEPSVLRRVFETADATLALRSSGAVFSALGGVAPVTLDRALGAAALLEGLGLDELVLPASATPSDLVRAIERSRKADPGDVLAECRSAGEQARAHVRRATRLLGLSTADEEAA